MRKLLKLLNTDDVGEHDVSADRSPGTLLTSKSGAIDAGDGQCRVSSRFRAPDSLRDVSFIIPVRNDAQRLQRCLETVFENEYPAERIEVIVADNGSTDESPRVARDAGATVLDLPGLTVAELRNRGAQAARGAVLAFVDADHEIGSGWLRAAVETLSRPDVAAAGALCRAPAPGTWVQQTYDALRRRASGSDDVEWLGSGNMAVRRAVFAQLGGFDVRLGTCEDVELCQRIRSSGHRIVHDDRMASIHHGDPATLRALFLGELWRGSDNLRVSLQGPLTLRAIPSIAIPVIDVGCILALISGLLLAPIGAWPLAVAGAGGIGALATMRAARMIYNSDTGSAPGILQALVVALVYDVARALALLIRTPHGSRRPARLDGIE